MRDTGKGRRCVGFAGGARAFVVFGVGFELQCEDEILLQRLVDALVAFFPLKLRPVGTERAEHSFKLVRSRGVFQVDSPYGGGPVGRDESAAIRHLRNLVRICVASNAKRHLFIHAGVVGVDDRAVLLPGDSHCGKTTLVKELVSLGATYYSDEYAVIDRKGSVLPFAKPLSVRGIEGPEIQTDVAPHALGATIGTRTLRVGAVMFVQYRPRARWKPDRLSEAQGRLLLIPHAIGLANRPKRGLNFLENALSGVTFWASERGEVSVAARKLLQTLDY